VSWGDGSLRRGGDGVIHRGVLNGVSGRHGGQGGGDVGAVAMYGVML
jgi:hypothetical protein